MGNREVWQHQDIDDSYNNFRPHRSPRGQVITDDALLIEIDQLEPIGSLDALGDAEGPRKVMRLLLAGKLGVPEGRTYAVPDALVDQAAIEELAELGRAQLDAAGIVLPDVEKSYFEARGV